MAKDCKIYEQNQFELQSGEIFPKIQLAYQTHGQLNAAKSNVILMPTYYTGTHKSNARVIGRDRVLDSDRFFVIVPNMLGNGISSSPSNTGGNLKGAQFPLVTLFDNVRLQQSMLQELWGIEQIRLVIGWSMGAMQTYQWAAQYPEQVQAILPYCGSAKTSPHNYVFLEGVKAALTADCDWNGGEYERQPVTGLKAFARVYAGWAYSQSFFRDALYKRIGFSSIQALFSFWENDHLKWDANDLLAMLRTWQHGDISSNHLYEGNFVHALNSICARAIVAPCSTDLYFPRHDNAFEVSHMPNAELRVIESEFGHCAANPGLLPEVNQFLRTAVDDLLQA